MVHGAAYLRRYKKLQFLEHQRSGNGRSKLRMMDGKASNA